MKRLKSSVILFALIAVSSVTACGEQVFFAREFLYTRAFKRGPDVFPETFPMALNARGIYVAGSFFTALPSAAQPGARPPEPQGLIRGYDTSGNERWTRQIAEQAGTFPSLMTADTTSLYVAGSVGYGRTDLFLRKYDDAGNELWSRKIRISDGYHGYHLATGLALDASGIYVAGWNGFSQGILRRYSPAGDELWSRTMRVFNLGGVAVDSSGIYLVGWSDPATGFLRKYTTGGDEMWTREVDTGQVCACSSIQAALTVDATGVYIAGEVVSKLDLSGNTVWKRPFSPIGDRVGVADLRARAAALDATGLYVAGTTERALPGQCKAGNGDVYVRKYDLVDGTERWTRQFGTSGREFLGGVAVDSTGVYVSGGIRGGHMHGNIFVTKLGKMPADVDYYTRPQIRQECVVNAASYVGGGVAPGEMVTIFGQEIGPAELTRLRIGDDGRLATTLADTRILFNGIAAPLLYVSATQSSAIVPYAVADRSTVTVEIENRGARSEPLTLPVARSRPGVFTADGSGYGQGAILNADGSLNSAANPAERGSIIVLYLTGEGLTEPVAEDGAILGDTLPKPKLPVSVQFEDPRIIDWFDPVPDEEARPKIVYAGAVPGSVAGLLQVNVRVPTWARSGTAVPFYVQVGDETAEAGFTVALR